MKLQLVPDNDAEKAAFDSGMVPRLAMMSWLGGCMSRLLVVAVKLDVFARLAAGARSADTLSEELKLDRHGLTVLLEGLTGFGALRRQNDVFELTEETRQWLLPDSPISLSSMVAMFDTIGSWLANLEGAVRTGEVTNFHFATDAPGWKDYLGLLNVSAGFDAPRLVDAVSFAEPPQRMLDVAGGPGRYSIAFAQTHPGLDVDILDLPESAREGEKHIAAAGLADRIRYHVGDIFARDWPQGPYDMILISHFLHCLPEQQSLQVLRRAAEHLRPGGRMVIHEVYIGGSTDQLSAESVTFSLVYYAGTGGRCWPVATYERWLNEVGMSAVAAQQTKQGAVVVQGYKR